jgi:hypothetical protein
MGMQGGKNFSAGEAVLKGGDEQIASSERKKPAITHPVRGKVLEFATKMLPTYQPFQPVGSGSTGGDLTRKTLPFGCVTRYIVGK